MSYRYRAFRPKPRHSCHSVGLAVVKSLGFSAGPSRALIVGMMAQSVPFAGTTGSTVTLTDREVLGLLRSHDIDDSEFEGRDARGHVCLRHAYGEFAGLVESMPATRGAVMAWLGY